jgi:hypothetical protein
LTLTQEAGGYVLRWQGPPDTSKILYYTVEIKKDGQGEKWRPLTDHRIDTEEASYMSELVGWSRVARLFIFEPKIPIWVDFGGPWNGKCWYIL